MKTPYDKLRVLLQDKYGSVEAYCEDRQVSSETLRRLADYPDKSPRLDKIMPVLVDLDIDVRDLVNPDVTVEQLKATSSHWRAEMEVSPEWRDRVERELARLRRQLQRGKAQS